MNVRLLKAVVLEDFMTGVKLEIPMEDGSSLVAHMMIDSHCATWHLADNRPVSFGEFYHMAKPGCVLQIDGTIELHGRRGICTSEDYAKSRNRFWITPYRVKIYDEPSTEERSEE